MRWTRVTAAGVLLAGAIAAQEWEIDSAHSSVQFAVRHMMVATVRGQFGKLTGKVRWDPAKPSEARVEAQVEVGSIDTREPKRDAHLRSPDFFDAEKFPTMTFRSTSVTPVGPGRYRLSGDLTIRGITRPVVFEVEGPGQPVRGMGGELRTGATATAKINRKDFGITWNRVLDTGGVAIGEDVAITVDVALVQKTAR
ncbi:MAG: YceI family protein [Bryobacterales bacterium]|nr:YceI family protein [Bryobacterales bacterium]